MHDATAARLSLSQQLIGGALVGIYQAQAALAALNASDAQAFPAALCDQLSDALHILAQLNATLADVAAERIAAEQLGAIVRASQIAGPA